MGFDLALRGGTVILPELGPLELTIAIADGRVVELVEPGQRLNADSVLDIRGLYIFPGVVDPHVHFGLAQGNEDFETETASAAVGGVTTVLGFFRDYERPRNYQELFREMKTAAGKLAAIDYGLHVVIFEPEHLELIRGFYEDERISSFKLYTTHRGSEAQRLSITGFDDGYILRAQSEIAGLKGGRLCVHAEDMELIQVIRERYMSEDTLEAWARSRPGWVEASAISRVVNLSRRTGCPLYVLHVTSQESLEVLTNPAVRRLLNNHVVVETCPHYLTHTSSDSLGSLGKVTPPLKWGPDCDALWRYLAEGVVGSIGSDHIARRKEKKSGDIWSGPGGFPGSATILPMLLSEGHHRRGIDLQIIARITSLGPARSFNLYPRKGTLLPGSDADFVVVDLELEQKVTPEKLFSYADYSLYEGWKFRGWPVLTYVRGRKVAENGKPASASGWGRFVPTVPGTLASSTR